METYKLDVEKIKRLSFRKGMSISGLCERAGMTRSRATEWKTRGVYPQTVYRIASVLDVDPVELIISEVSHAED